MSRPAVYLVVYDLGDEERQRVSKLLEGFGFRLQYSVFRCPLTRAMREDLLRRLRALDLQSGWVGLYRLMPSAKPCQIGKVPEDPFGDDQYAFVI